LKIYKTIQIVNRVICNNIEKDLKCIKVNKKPNFLSKFSL